jgi:ribonuclease VapC
VVVDTSAVAAILLQKPDAQRFADAIEASNTAMMSAANVVECGTVMLYRKGRQGRGLLTVFLRRSGIVIVPVTEPHVAAALDAYERYGKGISRPGLNFGDCFAYALAKTTDQPLLFKGGDFAKTDIAPA